MLKAITQLTQTGVYWRDHDGSGLQHCHSKIVPSKVPAVLPLATFYPTDTTSSMVHHYTPQSQAVQVYCQKRVDELFDNVLDLYGQVEALFTGRRADEKVGYHMAGFCVYLCGLHIAYICKYHQRMTQTLPLLTFNLADSMPQSTRTAPPSGAHPSCSLTRGPSCKSASPSGRLRNSGQPPSTRLLKTRRPQKAIP